MKILMVLPTLAGGGAEMVAATLSREFAKCGHTPLFALFRDEVDYPFAGKKFILDLPEKSRAGGRFRAHIRRHTQLRKTIKEQSPDVILSFLEAPNFHNILVNKRAVISIRSSKSASVGPPFTWKWLVKFVYRSSWRIISVSEEIKNNIVHSFGISADRLVMIPNPIDIPKVREYGNEPLDDKWKNIFSQPVIVNVGSFRREKAQHLLISAFAKALIRRPNINLLLLGDGPLRRELLELAKSLGIEQHVYMPGRVNNPFKYVKKSRVMALPSYSEGWPNALVESLALQVPVVATDCYSGPREILSPKKLVGGTFRSPKDIKCGKLIPPWRGGNSELEELTYLEDALVEAIDQGQGFWPQEEFDQLVENLRADEIAKKYLTILESAID